MFPKKNSDKIGIIIVSPFKRIRDSVTLSLFDIIDIEVLDTAPNGHLGILKALQNEPDVIILDIEINDLEPAVFTKEILQKLGRCGIILITKKDISESIMSNAITSLEYGAFDIIEEPNRELSEERKIMSFKRRLSVKIHEYSIKRYSQITREISGIGEQENASVLHPLILKHKDKVSSNYEMLCIGVSTGGPKALSVIVPQLPVSFPVPIVIVIHLPKNFTSGLALELNKKSNMNVLEAKDDVLIDGGNIYIARGGKHLIISKNKDNRNCFKYIDDPPENNCKPSIDVFFRSVASVYDKKVISVILTGMGTDGAKGMKLLKDKGATTFVQDKDSSVVWGMPGAAVNKGCVDEILPLKDIFPRVMEII